MTEREWLASVRQIICRTSDLSGSQAEERTEAALAEACLKRPLQRQARASISVEPDAWEIDVSDICLAEKIGEGASAEVYRASWNGRQVAVKQLRAHSERDQLAFHREASFLQSVAQGNHQNLVQVLGVCTHQEPLEIVTEFCAGGSYFDLLYNRCIDDGCPSWPQLMKICMDVSAAMEHLHGANPQIIHRDLKSLNVLLLAEISDTTVTPHAKVSDFGLARPKARHMTECVGTFLWMAPELLANKDYDEKVDVYSYGMMLHETIWRMVPFEGVSEADLPKRVQNGDRPPRRPCPPGCPEELPALMKMCWHQDPRRRPVFETVSRFLNVVAVERRCGDRWQL